MTGVHTVQIVSDLNRVHVMFSSNVLNQAIVNAKKVMGEMSAQSVSKASKNRQIVQIS